MESTKASITATTSSPVGWRAGLQAFALISVSVLAFAPHLAMAQGDKDPSVIIEIKDAEIHGSGCKKGTSKIHTYHSKGPGTPVDSFLVEHTTFSVGRMQKNQRLRVYCNAALKVELPIHPDKTKSYQFGITAVRHSGYMELLEGVKAKITTKVGMRLDTSLKLKASESTEGPFEGDFTRVFTEFFDKDGKKVPYYSDCGREPTFNIGTEIKLMGESGQDRKDSTLVIDKVSNDDEADKRSSFAQDYRIHWRECDLPKEDGGR